jgi:hypothetical protein
LEWREGRGDAGQHTLHGDCPPVDRDLGLGVDGHILGHLNLAHPCAAVHRAVEKRVCEELDRSVVVQKMGQVDVVAWRVGVGWVVCRVKCAR